MSIEPLNMKRQYAALLMVLAEDALTCHAKGEKYRLRSLGGNTVASAKPSRRRSRTPGGVIMGVRSGCAPRQRTGTAVAATLHAELSLREEEVEGGHEAVVLQGEQQEEEEEVEEEEEGEEERGEAARARAAAAAA